MRTLYSCPDKVITKCSFESRFSTDKGGPPPPSYVQHLNPLSRTKQRIKETSSEERWYLSHRYLFREDSIMNSTGMLVRLTERQNLTLKETNL